MNSQVTDHSRVTNMMGENAKRPEPLNSTENDEVDPSVGQAILENYDRESITRNITHGPVKYFIAGLCIVYSLFHLYITFNPIPALLQRSVYVGIGFGLIFLIFPASKKSSRQHVA